MPWFPGYEQIYNERLSPKVPYGAAKSFVHQIGLAALHPGLMQYTTRDAFTASLFIRPRLQTQVTHNPIFDVPETISNAGAAPATGGKGSPIWMMKKK